MLDLAFLGPVYRVRMKRQQQPLQYAMETPLTNNKGTITFPPTEGKFQVSAGWDLIEMISKVWLSGRKEEIFK